MSNPNMQVYKGKIGRGRCAPTKRMQGDDIKMMRFTLICNDYSKPQYVDKETNKKKYQKLFLEVYMPRTKYGASMFDNLAADRYVEVHGNMFTNAKIGKTQEGEEKAYGNLSIQLESLVFLDEPVEWQARKIFNILQDKELVGDKAISDETCALYMSTIKKFADSMKGTVTQDSAQETPNGDPEEPGF